MTRTAGIGLIALFAIGCGTSAPTSPTSLSSAVSLAPGTAMQGVAPTCEVNVGTTAHPLPAVHELEHWLNEAIAATGGVNCGHVRSLDAKMEALAKALDEEPPNHEAACGISGALANELAALVATGSLTTPTFPPPFPGGPTNVLAAAQALNGRWCAAARGDLEGPRS